ncbi:MAG: universal stress protein [Candidatus Methylomirabilota bacterium]|nr:DUF2249 domain-containing protein [Candidatus Methylomirabilis sp.]NJD68816.1 DUF2249 domain-containing protein [candidate division NC10 bacterium]PWB46060.1 MAG: universal stress protein [candidate division NC10 bacterium]
MMNESSCHGEGASMPEAIRNVPDDRRVTLDVRDQVRAGQEPFQRIMQTVMSLRDDQVFTLYNIFEPIPLYGVMAQRGFAHWTQKRGPEDWCITFYRTDACSAAAPAPAAASRPAPPTGDAIVVDARGLEPPQPMAKILENLPRITAGGQILAMTDRRPMLLYPKLEERGFSFSTEETTNGWFETRIWK